MASSSLDVYFNDVLRNPFLDVRERMKHELVRFSTFASFPAHSSVFPSRLARAGFYYTERSDQVRCFSCDITYENWKVGDCPEIIHRHLSPRCEFINGLPLPNVPSDSYGHGSILDESRFNQSTYVPIVNRSEGTLTNLDSTRISQTATIAAIETNVPDSQYNDTEHVERGRWTGQDIVSTHNNDRNGGAVNMLNKLDTGLGINFEKPRHPEYAVLGNRLKSFDHWPQHFKQKPQEMASAGLYYAGFEDCVRCFFCGGGLKHWEDGDNPWTEHARWFAHCVYLRQVRGEKFIQEVQRLEHNVEEVMQHNFSDSQAEIGSLLGHLSSPAAQSVLEMGYSEDLVKAAIENIRKQGPCVLTAQVIFEETSRLDELESTSCEAFMSDEPRAEKQPSNCKLGDRNAPDGKRSHHQESHNSLVEENRQLKEQTLCKICLDEEISVVFLPCGHMVSCTSCAPALRHCPVCRAVIKGTVKAFMA